MRRMTIIWVAFALLAFCPLLSCGDSATETDTPSDSQPTVVLNEQEKATLTAAESYLSALQNRLQGRAPDGIYQFFNRRELRGHIQAMGALPQTNAVVSILIELVGIDKAYYEVGYLTQEWELIQHHVSVDDWGDVESLSYLSARYGVSENEWRRFNPNDIDGNGIVTYISSSGTDSLPKLVAYTRKDK